MELKKELNMTNKSVCGDLLGRLESRLPGSSPLLKNKSTEKVDPLTQVSNGSQDIIRKLEEDSLKFKSQPPAKEAGSFPLEPIEETEPELKQEPEVEAEPQIESKLYTRLQEIVSKFNEDLAEWFTTTGCVANFGWKYQEHKSLEITGIDYIVYRKPAPSGERIKDILAKHSAEK
jgi:hypothetical protein